MNNKEYLEYLIQNYTSKSKNPTSEGLKEYLQAIKQMTQTNEQIGTNNIVNNNGRERAKQKVYTSGKSVIDSTLDKAGFISVALLAMISFFSEISFLLLSFLIYK